MKTKHFVILAKILITILFASCSASAIQDNSLSHSNNTDFSETLSNDDFEDQSGNIIKTPTIPMAEHQMISAVVAKLKERHDLQDREIKNIDRLVFAQWYPTGLEVMIVYLDDNGDWDAKDYIGMIFDGPPNYDNYGKSGPKAYFVEQFIDQVNEKKVNGTLLNSFIQQDLIVTLEFSDDSKVVFDRYYKEIEENLEDYQSMIE